MKKFIAFIFAALFAAGAWAHQYEATVDGVTWYYNVKNGKAEITYRGSYYDSYSNEYSGSLTIPSTLGGYSVTTIGYEAFRGCSSLTSVTIPDSVTTIGELAFYNCSSLTSVTIPDSVTEIGDYAFRSCSSLTSVTIPDSVTTIGYDAFFGCSSLKEIIGWRPGCPTNVERIVISDSVTTIGSYAFQGCSSLTSVTIPNGVTSIGSYAFEGCSSLTSVTIPNGVTSIGSSAFDGCSSLTSVTIADSVTTIGEYAFYGCSSLTSVTIPDSVTTIGHSAFYNCSLLTSVSMPDSVTTIGSCSFAYCSSLTSITIPNSVTSIGSSAFYECSSLKSITIPDSVKTIGEYAFGGCSSLTSITIPNSVTSIGAYAFGYCSSLTSITIPDSVTTIGSSAFSNCSSLKTVYVDSEDANRVKELMRGKGVNVDNLTFSEIGDPVTTVPKFIGEVYGFWYDEEDCGLWNVTQGCDPDGEDWAYDFVDVGGKKEPGQWGGDGNGYMFPVTITQGAAVTPEIIPLNSTANNFCDAKVLTDEQAKTRFSHNNDSPYWVNYLWPSGQTDSTRVWIYVEGKRVTEGATYRFDLSEKKIADGTMSVKAYAEKYGAKVEQCVEAHQSQSFKIKISETGEILDQRLWLVDDLAYNDWYSDAMDTIDDNGGDYELIDVPGLWFVSGEMIDNQRNDPQHCVIKLLPGEGTGAAKRVNLDPNKVYNLPENTFAAPKGKKFVGWEGSNGKRYDDKMLVFNPVPVGEVLTLTAIWE